MGSKYGHLANMYGKVEVDFTYTQLTDDECGLYIDRYGSDIHQEVKRITRYQMDRMGTGFAGGMIPSSGVKTPEPIVEIAVRLKLDKDKLERGNKKSRTM